MLTDRGLCKQNLIIIIFHFAAHDGDKLASQDTTKPHVTNSRAELYYTLYENQTSMLYARMRDVSYISQEQCA